MEAKDTVMSDDRLQEIWLTNSTAYSRRQMIAGAQAEISFKAGLVKRQEQYEKRIKELQETCNQWERLSKDFKLAGIKEVVK